MFPGGRVEADDAAAALRNGLSEDVASRALRGLMEPAAALACFAAAARELREEAGVELSDLRALEPWSRWVTPPVEARRFDTWFFLATAPEGAQPLADDVETEAGRWVPLRSAQGLHECGELVLAPPTYVTLLELAALPSVAAALDAARGRQLQAIEPVFTAVDGEPTLLLPGDPLHPAPAQPLPTTRLTMRSGAWWSVTPT